MRLVTFPHGVRKLHFIFGPYAHRVPGTFGVRLTEDYQLDAPCDLHFPIKDFGVPRPVDFEELLITLINIADTGRVLYVGCYGGIGRTGMVVAGLARALVITDDPVRWARTNYLGHAVETDGQQELIRIFNVNRVRAATFRGAVEARTPASDSVPAINGLQLTALWGKVMSVFGNARRQAGDNPRK